MPFLFARDEPFGRKADEHPDGRSAADSQPLGKAGQCSRFEVADTGESFELSDGAPELTQGRSAVGIGGRSGHTACWVDEMVTEFRGRRDHFAHL